MLRVQEIMKLPDFGDQVLQITAEKQVLEQTSKGDQVAPPLDMLLRLVNDGATAAIGSSEPEVMQKLISELFWAQQTALKMGNDADRQLLLDHDPDLQYVLAYLTLQPVAETQAGIHLALRYHSVELKKTNILQPGATMQHAALLYREDGLQIVLDLMEKEIERRRKAVAKVIGPRRDRTICANDRRAILQNMKHIQDESRQTLDLLQSSKLPKEWVLADETEQQLFAPFTDEELRNAPHLQLHECGAEANAKEATA